MDDFETELLGQLKAQYNFDHFRPGQLEVLTALLAEQQDVLAVLPTGTGKSLIYQLAGQKLGGLTVIVSPLLSLMQDQVGRLNSQGIKRAVALNSMQKYATKQFILENLHQFDYLFIAPETLMQENVLSALTKLKINLLVVDEAHSIAQWGPDFRPDYLQLGRVYKIFGKPRLLLLTATASLAIREEIKQQFELEKPMKEYIYSVNRPNIHLRTERLASEQEKHKRLIELVNTLPGPGIIYLSSKKQANQITNDLQMKTTRNIATYHGDVVTEQRFAIQQQFMNNQLDVIVATSAFGMGIDKGDIRWVIHYHLSTELESYLQEIGRAGRDLQPAIAILMYTETDDYLVTNLLLNGIPDELAIKHYYRKTHNYTFDPQHLRLLMYYEANGFTELALLQLFKQRLKVKQLALQKMLQYIRIDNNKRNFLITSFGDKPLEGDVAGNWSTEKQVLDIQALGLPIPNKRVIIDGDTWQTRLDKLFNQ